jgi:hypothetical protein
MPAGRPEIGEYWINNHTDTVWHVGGTVGAHIAAQSTHGGAILEHVIEDFVRTCTYLDLRAGMLFLHHRTGERRVITRVNPNFTVSYASDGGRDVPYDTTPVAEFMATHRPIDPAGFTRTPLTGFSRLLPANPPGVLLTPQGTLGPPPGSPQREDYFSSQRRQRVMAAEDEAVFAALNNVAADDFIDLHTQVPLSALGRQPANAPIQGVVADLQAMHFLARLSPQQRELLRARTAESEQDFLRSLSNDRRAELRSSPDLLRAVLWPSPASLKSIEPDPEPPRLCWDHLLDDED